jgi:hypothetical protein
LSHWGTKSGSRKVFREAGIDHPAGFEDLADAVDVADALVELKAKKPSLRKAVVKLNEGFSGEGNALLDLESAPERGSLVPWVRARLPHLAFEAKGMTWETFQDKLGSMGGIVEEFVPGKVKESPSAQLRVDPKGRVEVISTHDQVLGGRSGQIFLGCRFPAAKRYRLDIQERGLQAAQLLAGKGVIGRFGVDFISIKEGDCWRHLAIEINLRKGGTTHPFQMLQFLTDGRYDTATGQFLTMAGQPRCYYASDNLESECYRGLTPELLRKVGDGRGQAASGCWLTASMPSMNFTPVISFGKWLWPSRRRQLFSAACASLKTMAIAVLFERHPLERTVRCRTVANVLSMGLVVRRCFQCSAGKS